MCARGTLSRARVRAQVRDAVEGDSGLAGSSGVNALAPLVSLSRLVGAGGTYLRPEYTDAARLKLAELAPDPRGALALVRRVGCAYCQVCQQLSQHERDTAARSMHATHMSMCIYMVHKHGAYYEYTWCIHEYTCAYTYMDMVPYTITCHMCVHMCKCVYMCMCMCMWP